MPTHSEVNTGTANKNLVLARKDVNKYKEIPNEITAKTETPFWLSNSEPKRFFPEKKPLKSKILLE